MEDNRIQPREIIANSNLRLKRQRKCAIGAIIILGVLLFALILLIAIYIPNLVAQIDNFKNHQCNSTSVAIQSNSSTIIKSTPSANITSTAQTSPQTITKDSTPITDPLVKFLTNSKCATDTQQRNYLASLIGNKPTTLIYSGSAHGWLFKDFHSRCDNKAPTITLFKIKYGDCVGGYTAAQWTSDDKWVVDNTAMLFNLPRQRQFLNSKQGDAIYGSSYYGPSFGDYYVELSAVWQPFNGNGNCRSLANRFGYKIPIEGGKNMLTNQADGWFTIDELEVWLVE